MRLLICAPLLLVACSAVDEDVQPHSLIQLIGQIENKHLDEASGLARSNRHDDLYWVINDDGPAVVHALNSAGENLGEVEISEAKNRDWEDIASFVHDGTAYLAVGDIGDNEAKHKKSTVYVVEEPDIGDEKTKIAWRVSFSYPDGPADAESLAVDASEESIYVLSKRTIPAVLYRIPLIPESDETIVAARIVVMDSLPQPSQIDIANAPAIDETPRNGWHWQPTGMDFAPDGKSALILTYAAVFYFSRDANQSWSAALQGQAMQLKLGKYYDAESITYSTDGMAAIATVEGKHAPILRIDLSEIEVR